MNGHITADGITRDLEALSQAGIGGVLNYNAGIAIPKGPVGYFSDKWFELLQHTVNEAERLGLEYSMHNCPGWSSSGGPWVTPEMSMQKVVWTETMVHGGKMIAQKLPQPLSTNNYYRDTFVVAFPSFPGEDVSWKEKIKSATTNKGVAPIDDFVSGKGIFLEKSSSSNGFLLLQFEEPLSFETVLLNAISNEAGEEVINSVGPFTLESADDGKTFTKIGVIPRVSITTPGNLDIAPVTARYFKISTPAKVKINDINLYSSSRRLQNWVIKANYSLRPSRTRMAITAPNAGKQPPTFPPEPEFREMPAQYVIDPKKVIDITSFMDSDGQFTWDAPAGNWTILRFGHTSTGATNRAAPDNGQGLECDKFSKEAFDFHFDQMFERIAPILKNLAVKGRVGIEIDSYEVGMQNWTRAFPSEFERSRKYSLLKYMPTFTGRVVGSNQETENFLWDARRVMADMMAENYYGRCAERCHENGFVFYGEPYKLGPMEGMQAGSKMDNVMGEFWARGQRNRHSLKLASSIQHLNGKKIVAAESFTGHGIYSKWQQYPFAMKASGDFMFTKGLTRIIFHTSAHQPHPTAKPGMTMGPFGTHIDRNVTWFDKSKPWLRYISRCQYMLQQGLVVADLLYFTGEDAPGEELALKEYPEPIPPFGYDFDYINAEILLNKVGIKNGRITLPDGMSYSLLILPPKPSITLRVLEKLAQLVGKGMKMMGDPPTELSGLTDYPDEMQKLKQLVSQIWGSGSATVFRTGPLDTVLNKLNIQEDFKYTSESSDPAINYIHRTVDGNEMYFVCNRKRRLENLVCSFRVNGKKPEFWDADTGTTTPISVYSESAGRINIPVQFQPSGSIFIVFKEPADKAAYNSVQKNGKRLLGTSPFAAIPKGRYKNVSNNFTQGIWLKPESDIAVTGMGVMRREDVSSFIFSPAQGEKLYGKDHAICGATAGRNGVVVYERLTELIDPVFEVLRPLEGWTHLALVYKSGAPSVYLNGALVGTGKASKATVHPSLNEEYQDVYTLFFEGDSAKPQFFNRVLSESEIKKLAAEVPVEQAKYPEVEILPTAQSDLIFWSNGNYELGRANGRSKQVSVTGLREPVQIAGEWLVTFPEGIAAPEQIRLPKLMSLHKHPVNGVKYFSGTASYTNSFQAQVPKPGERIYLDLGQVEVLAEVELNGKNLGIVWKQPYRLDISSAIKNGTNELLVKVTNLWPNRLIGDEHLPEENKYSDRIFEGQVGGYGIEKMPDWYIKGEPKPPGGRTTFSTWKHFEKDDPLLESGLVGPVMLRVGKLITLEKHNEK
jgi:hypothetical protein